MLKAALVLTIGLVGALIVHIAVVFRIPDVAENNAWARLSRLGETLQPVVIDPSSDEGGGLAFAFLDPAFLTAACRFSLGEGPVWLSASDQTGFWSASIYSREGDNLYSINERAALSGRFDLLVGTAAQIESARVEGLVGGTDTIPVEVAFQEGYVTLRGLVDQESNRPYVDRFIRSMRCETVVLESLGS